MALTIAFSVSCLLFVAMAGLCLYLFITLKSELVRTTRRLEGQLAELRRAAAEAPRPVALPAPAPAPVPEPAITALAARPSFNLSRRTQAVRMFRHGNTVDQIASALAAPRNEVELLLKIHELSN